MEGVGGRTLPELYQDWTRMVSKTRDGLETFERFTFSSPPSDGGMDPTELDGHIDAIPLLPDGLPLAVFRRKFRARKVEQVAQEADSLKESLDRYFLRNQRRTQEARERAELLNGESSYVLRIYDDEVQAMQSARNANGVAICVRLAGQSERLKSTMEGTGCTWHAGAFKFFVKAH
ncbi:membrin 11 [Actinidia rufa]|uniref:Membrin 11 n=1 Tax=Actinidia rufa TaxID=165716 RepID=A0A7J0GEX8_9ERIC|nr:membrin 11 [Actinidia rufa]